MQLVGQLSCKREQLRDVTGDPWDGRTLEWATSSPPPAYNFAFTPVVHDNDAWWRHEEARLRSVRSTGFKPIHMPKNTGAGVILAGLATVVRLRPDLAHVVAGGAELRRDARRRRSATPSTTTATSTSRPTRSSAPRTRAPDCSPEAMSE